MRKPKHGRKPARTLLERETRYREQMRRAFPPEGNVRVWVWSVPFWDSSKHNPPGRWRPMKEIAP